MESVFSNTCVDKLINDIKQEQIRILNRTTTTDEEREKDTKCMAVLNGLNLKALQLKSLQNQKVKKR